MPWQLLGFRGSNLHQNYKKKNLIQYLFNIYVNVGCRELLGTERASHWAESGI